MKFQLLKKVLSLSLCAALTLSLAACSLGDTLGGSGSMDSDKLYSELSSAADNPDSLRNNALLNKKITFTALVVSDPETFEFDAADGGDAEYVYAVISRNVDSEILLNVNKLEKKPAMYDLVSVTGTMVGSVSGVVDNKTQYVLDITVDSLEFVEASDTPQNTSNISMEESYPLNQKATFTFTGGGIAQDISHNNVALMYFNFANEGENDWDPKLPLGRIDFYQGDTRLRITSSVAASSSIKESLDPQALEAHGSQSEKTLPGKTNLYYFLLIADEDGVSVEEGTPITARFYDDDFNLVSEVEIPLSAPATGE